MPDLQPTQNVNPHTMHIPTNTKSTHINQTHSPRDDIMPPVTMFKQNQANNNGHRNVVTFHQTIQQNPTITEPQWFVQI